jgi:hypothetical protein
MPVRGNNNRNNKGRCHPVALDSLRAAFAGRSKCRPIFNIAPIVNFTCNGSSRKRELGQLDREQKFTIILLKYFVIIQSAIVLTRDINP